MKEHLAILEPQVMKESEDSEDNLEDNLGKLVEKAANTAMSTTMAKSNSEGLQGTSQTQMTDLMEGKKDLCIKLDATLECVTIMKSDLIQDSNRFQLEEQMREHETLQAIQKRCDDMVQATLVPKRMKIRSSWIPRRSRMP